MIVYVITPALNKSFKFQSEWPFNSSQAYILASLLEDIKNKDDVLLEETENNYILKTKVNYPNNQELSYQKLIFDKKMNIEGVEVYDNEDIVKIKVSFTSIDLKAGLDKEDFLLEDLINEDCCEEEVCTNNSCDKNQEGSSSNAEENNKDSEETAGTLESIIYPLYIPSNTHLKSSERIDTDTGERVILTFSGDKDFVLIEETARIAKEFEIIPVFGDPMMVYDTVAALSANSLSWTLGTIDYYLASNELSPEEMITIAASLGNTQTVVESK